MHLSENETSRNDTQCHCPPSCKSVEYDATVSTSHLSEQLLVDSLVAERTREDFHRRYRDAREVRAWVDVGENSAVATLRRMRLLVGQVGNLRAIVGIDLLNDITSIVQLLSRNVLAIVQQTTHDLLTFRKRVVDPLTASGGYATELIEWVKRLGDYAQASKKEMDSLNSKDERPFD